MGTVRTFCAQHGKGVSLVLALLCVLTYTFAVERSWPDVDPPSRPPQEWARLHDGGHAIEQNNRRVAFEDLRAALAQQEDPRKELERVLLEVEKSSSTNPPEVVKPKETPIPPPVPIAPPAPPALVPALMPKKVLPEPTLEWVDPITPPTLMKEGVPEHDAVIPPPAPVPPSWGEIAPPLPDKAPDQRSLPDKSEDQEAREALAEQMFLERLRHSGEPPLLPYSKAPNRVTEENPAEHVEEQEAREALAERRFLDLLQHSPEPPLFVQAPKEIKRLLETNPASKAESRKNSLKDVAVVTRPDVADRPIDPIAAIQITTAPAEIIPARAQTDEPPGVLPSFLPVRTESCPSCGRHGKHGRGGRSGCSTCGNGQCYPGRKPGFPCESNTIIGGFLCDLYECVCCPDPCYDPKWIPQADAAFFVDAARPVSQMRIGWDAGRNMLYPDRSEYFWARADGAGKGPKVNGGVGERSVRYDDLIVYTETAAGGFSTIVNFPYRNLSPDLADHSSGFIDMTVGTKSLLFDCEMLQVSFQFLTYIPTGNFTKGLGVGHLSLEPSVLMSLKFSPNTYMQAQLAEWIPLGGDPDYAGAILHSHASINQVLYRVTPDVPIIGTFEVSTYSFQDGAYTDPVLGANQRSGGTTYAYVGPGMRMFICDRMDFGAGAQFAVTQDHFAQTVVRVMFRYRF